MHIFPFIPSFIIPIIVFAVLIRLFLKYFKGESIREKQLMSLVLRYHIVNIYELQKRTAMSEADLYRNLNSMIQRNMLPGYSINYQAKILERRIPYPTNPIPAPTPTMTKPIDDFKPGYRKCECCGASAYLQSPKQTCQYCGNAIDYKK